MPNWCRDEKAVLTVVLFTKPRLQCWRHTFTVITPDKYHNFRGDVNGKLVHAYVFSCLVLFWIKMCWINKYSLCILTLWKNTLICMYVLWNLFLNYMCVAFFLTLNWCLGCRTIYCLIGQQPIQYTHHCLKYKVPVVLLLKGEVLHYPLAFMNGIY